MSPRWGKGFDVHQLQLNWHTPQCQNQQLQSPADDTGTTLAGKPLLRLRWDFRTRYPQPTDDAINQGILQPEDAEPENIAALHSAHANRMLATLSDIDALADAARLGVDPTTGKPPAGDVGLQVFPLDHPRDPQCVGNEAIAAADDECVMFLHGLGKL